MILLIVGSTLYQILSRSGVSAMAPPAVIIERDPTPPHPAVPDFVAVLLLRQVLRVACYEAAWMLLPSLACPSQVPCFLAASKDMPASLAASADVKKPWRGHSRPDEAHVDIRGGFDVLCPYRLSCMLRTALKCVHLRTHDVPERRARQTSTSVLGVSKHVHG